MVSEIIYLSVFKKKWQFFLCQFFRYVCFTGKSKNLLETPIMKNIFIFLGNGHCVQKCSFLVKILSFLKEVFYVFEKCQFLITFSSSGNLMENSTFLLKFHFFFYTKLTFLEENLYWEKLLSQHDFITVLKNSLICPITNAFCTNWHFFPKENNATKNWHFSKTKDTFFRKLNIFTRH